MKRAQSWTNPQMKIRRANCGSLRALCLLSSQASVSRCHWAYVAALSSQGHFFGVAYYCFEGGLTRDLRLSTGSNALQPRVESGTPP